MKNSFAAGGSSKRFFFFESSPSSTRGVVSPKYTLGKTALDSLTMAELTVVSFVDASLGTVRRPLISIYVLALTASPTSLKETTILRKLGKGLKEFRGANSCRKSLIASRVSGWKRRSLSRPVSRRVFEA